MPELTNATVEVPEVCTCEEKEYFLFVKIKIRRAYKGFRQVKLKYMKYEFIMKYQ
jgi:hypothetical protein